MNVKKKGGKVAPSAEGGQAEFEGGTVNDIEGVGDDQLELVEEEADEVLEESPMGIQAPTQKVEEQAEAEAEDLFDVEADMQVPTEPPAEDQAE